MKSFSFQSFSLPIATLLMMINISTLGEVIQGEGCFCQKKGNGLVSNYLEKLIFQEEQLMCSVKTPLRSEYKSSRRKEKKENNLIFRNLKR